MHIVVSFMLLHIISHSLSTKSTSSLTLTHTFWRSEIKNTKTKKLVTCSHNFTARLTGLSVRSETYMRSRHSRAKPTFRLEPSATKDFSYYTCWKTKHFPSNMKIRMAFFKDIFHANKLSRPFFKGKAQSSDFTIYNLIAKRKKADSENKRVWQQVSCLFSPVTHRRREDKKNGSHLETIFD